MLMSMTAVTKFCFYARYIKHIPGAWVLLTYGNIHIMHSHHLGTMNLLMMYYITYYKHYHDLAYIAVALLCSLHLHAQLRRSRTPAMHLCASGANYITLANFCYYCTINTSQQWLTLGISGIHSYHLCRMAWRLRWVDLGRSTTYGSIG